MSDELISSYVNTAAIDKETKFMLDRLEAVYTQFQRIRNIKISLEGSKSFVEIAESIKKVKKEEDELLKIQAQIDATYRKRLALESEQAKILSEEKLLLQQRNQELKNTVRENNAAEGSLEQMRATLIRLNKEYDNLSKAEREGSFGTETKKNIAILTDELKALEAETGRSQRNVGNYAGSLTGSFEVLRNELEQIRAQLKQTGLSANEFEKLNQKAALLEKVLAGVDVATKTTKQEMRNFTEAAKQIGLEFGIASTQFQSFIKEVGGRKDELGDIQAAINFQASDTKYIDGVVEAVGGLAGAYGAAQGAAVIFGEGEKDIQESMAKLQASIAIVTGLQQVLKTVQIEGAAAQTLLAARTSLLSAAETVNAKIKAALGLSTTGLAIATAEQAVASEAAATAMTQQAVASEAAAVTNTAVTATGAAAATAMGAEAVATETATAATISFATAFAATGIGALIIALAAAIVYVVKTVQDYNAANDSMIESNKELSKSISESISALKEYDSVRNTSFKQQIEQAQRLGDLRKAAGVNAQQSLAIDIEVEKKKNEFAKLEVKRQQDAIGNIDKFIQKSKESAAYVLYLENQKLELLEKTKANGNKDYTEEKERIDEKIENAKNEAKAAKDSFDYLNGLKQEQSDSDQRLNLLQTQAAATSAADQRKIELESAKFRSDLIIDSNNRILSSETTTQQQRIEATRKIAEEQKKIALAENKSIQNDPTQSNAAKQIARENLGNTLIKISRDTNDKEQKINEDYRKRELAANQSFQKIVADEIIKGSEKIFNNENVSYENRLDAFKTFQQTKIDQINAEFEYQKELNKTNGSTKLEQELLEADHQAKLTALIAEGTAKQIEIQLSSFDVVTKKMEEQFGIIQKITEKRNAEIAANNSKAYAASVITLNEQLQNGNISLTKYNNERKKLDDNANKQSLTDTINFLEEQSKNLKQANTESLNDRQKYIDEYNKLFIKPLKTQEEQDELVKLKKQIEGYKDYSKEITEIDAKIQENRKNLSDANLELQKQSIAAISENYKQLGAEIVNLFKEIIKGGFQSQLDDIQASMDALDKKKAKEIEVAEQTITNEQDKAARIKIIEAKTQAEKDVLEQKKRKIQIEQARFEKASNIAGIIFNTAQAVIKTLAVAGPFSLPLAISIGLLGAAQLARAIATPLPRFKEGIGIGNGEHKGGYAIVGDGGKQEVVIEPSGKTYITPDTPTIMDLPAYTKVLPSVDDLTRVALLAATPTLKNFDGETMNNYELIGAMNKIDSRLASVERTIKNKKENHYHVTRFGMLAQQRSDNNIINYINDNINF